MVTINKGFTKKYSKYSERKDTEERSRETIAEDNIVTQRRVGRFRIDKSIVEGKPNIVREMMKHVIVIRCEYSYYYDAFYYTAYSDLFEPVKEGSKIPKYIFSTIQDGKVSAAKDPYQ